MPPEIQYETSNPARAASWIRVINMRLYNLKSVNPAVCEDFVRAFPKTDARWMACQRIEDLQEIKNELRALRDSLVDEFDIPADGGLGDE